MIVGETLLAGPLEFVGGLVAALGTATVVDCSISDLRREKKFLI